jgi:RNA polymerase sigma factor (sigma-70 family)
VEDGLVPTDARPDPNAERDARAAENRRDAESMAVIARRHLSPTASAEAEVEMKALFERRAGQVQEWAYWGLCNRGADPGVAAGAAEDIMMDVLMRICWERAAAFDPRVGPLIGLLAVTTAHEVSDWWRRYTRRYATVETHLPDQPDDIWDPADPDPGPEELLISDETTRLHEGALRALRSAVEELPLPDRAVIELNRLQGLTERGTADLLGIKRGSIRGIIVRAMRQLRAALADQPSVQDWLDQDGLKAADG